MRPTRRSLLKGLALLPALAALGSLSGRRLLPVSGSSIILADQINASLNAVEDWSPFVDVGIVMNKSSASDYDTWIENVAAKNDWLTVLMVKSYALHSGYSSPTIDQNVKLALSNIPMFEQYSIPITENDVDGQWFWPFCKFALYGYRYSRELNWETDRWDPNNAFSYLASVYDSFGGGFYRMNGSLDPTDPDSTTYAQTVFYGPRWLEYGKLIGCFLLLYEAGVSGGLDYALRCWQKLNSDLWKNYYYTYSSEWSGFEFSAMDVIVDALKLRTKVEAQGNYLTNAKRIFVDLNSRYLSGYGNAQWSNTIGSTAVTQHLKLTDDGTENFPSNDQLRMDGTLNAWILLHLARNGLSSDGQQTMQSMLEGNGMASAWNGLMNSGLAESPTFFYNSTSGTTSDEGTTMGALCLLLNGISVWNGPGLAIPLITDNENDHSAINSYHFGFDYDNQTLKIPVWSGTTLNFLFGENPVQLTFNATGVYSINFASDWNSILAYQWISGLKSDEPYLDPSQTVSKSPVPRILYQPR